MLKKSPKQQEPAKQQKQKKQKPTAVAFRLDHLNAVYTVGSQPSRRRLVPRHRLVFQQKTSVS